MSFRWRVVGVVLLILLFSWYFAASFVPAETRRATAWLPDQAIRLGLDLQGGIHWVLEADLAVAVTHELDHLRGRLAEQLGEEKISPERLVVEQDRILVDVAKPEDADAVRRLADETGVLRVVSTNGSSIELALTEPWLADVRKKGIDQILEVLRRRIDDPVRGVQDSVITRQGVDRVLVQIPGGQLDRERARELLKATGFLEFKIVKEEAPTEELLRARHPNGLPEGTELAFERDRVTNRVVAAYLVPTTPEITGDYLADARVGFDNQQRPIVTFTFTPEGGARFQEITEKNVGQRLAVVLDDLVHSAPQIRERIGARGQIDGRFTSEQAADLAVVLRSGSLAIPVKIAEERTVGPALGADSIRRGIQASAASLVAVFIFAVVYYRLSGVYATIAITVGMIMIVGLMAMAGATLTMPGFAGLVLTVGMAIDGNVLIFERIREELRAGKLPRAAIQAGFSRALLPILDGHITTMITALVLYQYGTGPIKGFAVTLAIGLIATVFQAVVVNRMLFSIYPGDRPVKTLSI